MARHNDPKHSVPFFVNTVDRYGREIAPAVLSAAMEIGARAIAVGSRELGDAALVNSLLEESVAAVSRTLLHSPKYLEAEVHNLPAYLFRTFMRKVDRTKEKELKLAKRAKQETQVSTEENIDLKILYAEVMQWCDPDEHDMLQRHWQGEHWDDIGKDYGISGHAARLRCSKAIQRLRLLARKKGSR